MITQDYPDLQSNLDAEYQSAYRQWVQSLPDHERRSLRSVGLEKPVSGYHGNGAPAGDAGSLIWCIPRGGRNLNFVYPQGRPEP